MSEVINVTNPRGQAMTRVITKKITILHVIGGMNKGGSETFIMNILRNLDRDRFAFIFLCARGDKYDYEDELVLLGARIIRTGGPSKVGLLKYLKNVRRIIHDENIDIVHAHTYYYAMFPLMAAKLAGVHSRIAHSHASKLVVDPGLSMKLLIFITKYFTNLLATSRLACGEEAGRSLFANHSFTIIHNAIVLDRFYYSVHARNAIRKQYGISRGSTVIGHVGRMDALKNQKFAIEVFAHYLKIDPNAYLMLIGDGEQRLENEMRVSSLGITERVIFLGVRGNIGDLYSAMDLFIFPSIYEGLGMVLIEAQANGLKSLVSDSVPQSANLTKTIEFYPLAKGAKAWASKLGTMDISRFDSNEDLEKGPYNVKIGVKVIERIYLAMLGKNNEK